MSTALRKRENCTFWAATVAPASTATRGFLAIFGAADDLVLDGGAGSDLGVGIFKESATAGQRVEIELWAPVVPVTVGTGGATRGTKAVFVADGFIDAPAHDSSGGTDNQIYGVFMQTGVVGDRVGMQLMASNRGSA